MGSNAFLITSSKYLGPALNSPVGTPVNVPLGFSKFEMSFCHVHPKES